MYSSTRERLFPNRWPHSYINVTTCMPFRIVLAQCVSEMCIMVIIQNLFAMFWSNFNIFVKIMKSDIHVYNVKNDNVTGFELS